MLGARALPRPRAWTRACIRDVGAEEVRGARRAGDAEDSSLRALSKTSSRDGVACGPLKPTLESTVDPLAVERVALARVDAEDGRRRDGDSSLA